MFFFSGSFGHDNQYTQKSSVRALALHKPRQVARYIHILVLFTWSLELSFFIPSPHLLFNSLPGNSYALHFLSLLLHFTNIIPLTFAFF